jgi:hypothetical protein
MPYTQRHHRSEVREFLRTRRARLTPEMAGLIGGGSRRVPGLTDPAGFNPVQVTGSAGTLDGFAIGGRDSQGNLVVDESTDNAVTWTPSRSFGQVPVGQSLGVVMLTDGTVVIVGTAPGRSGQPQLLEVAAQGTNSRTVTLSITH